MRSDELRIPTERVTKTWWKEAIVYQIYPASFFDSDGDGVGDIPGIISKLDYLQGLGVNVLWLSPIYKSPQVDMGYDVSDYRDIHTPYGTLSDVDHLIAELHNRRMKLLMDLVVNHTSDQHAWFKQSRSSKTDPKRDWYIWRSPRRDESGQRLPPNNWSSIFGGSAWQYDAVTDSYYLHLFAAEQPDLNFENPAVREAVHSDMRFWLDRGIDGFRMDSVNLLSKAPGLPDASVSCVGAPYQPAFKHFVNGPRIHEWLGEMNDKVLSNYDLMTVGELPMTPDPKDVLKFVASGRKELNMVFQTDLVDLGFGHEGKFFPYHWKLPELKRIVNKWQTLLAAQDGWNAVFLENHDNGRSVSRFASDAPRYRLVSAKMLAMLLGTLGGTLYLYQGQEIGMKNAPEDWGLEDYIDLEVRKAWETIQAGRGGPDADMTDVFREVQQKARDHARLPMQWNDSENAGFTIGKPWMRVNDDYPDWNAERQARDPDSALSFWKQIIALRTGKFKHTLTYGKFHLLAEDNENIFAYTREWKGEVLLCILNFSASETEFKIDETLCGKISDLLIGNYHDKEETQTPGIIRFHPYQGRLFTVK